MYVLTLLVWQQGTRILVILTINLIKSFKANGNWKIYIHDDG